ncbi:MAG: hypothetical protein WD929_07035 [Steroidobacteraceae bacterium]
MNQPGAKDLKPKRRPDPPPVPAHVDDLLDAALADTFPASDPVSGLTASAPIRRPAGDEGE